MVAWVVRCSFYMDPLKHPTVARALARANASKKAAAEDDTAFVIALVKACGSRDAAAAVLNISPRQLSRRLAKASVRARDLTGGE